MENPLSKPARFHLLNKRSIFRKTTQNLRTRKLHSNFSNPPKRDSWTDPTKSTETVSSVSNIRISTKPDHQNQVYCTPSFFIKHKNSQVLACDGLTRSSNWTSQSSSNSSAKPTESKNGRWTWSSSSSVLAAPISKAKKKVDCPFVNLTEFDSHGFAKIDQCVFSLKNPEKGACQYVRAFFGGSRLVRLDFMYHSVSLDYSIQSMTPQIRSFNVAEPRSSFMKGLLEISENCGREERK